jgi:hypothetical protein
MILSSVSGNGQSIVDRPERGSSGEFARILRFSREWRRAVNAVVALVYSFRTPEYVYSDPAAMTHAKM